MLADVYCLYNRARGTDPISPEDLAEAASKAMPSLGLGMRSRTYHISSSSSSSSSGDNKGGAGAGMTVLQLDSFHEEAVQARILEELEKATREAAAAAGGGAGASPSSLAHEAHTSPPDLASRWRLPMPIAKHLLLQAEQAGVLCRDDSIAGLRFYANRFLQKRE